MVGPGLARFNAGDRIRLPCLCPGEAVPAEAEAAAGGTEADEAAD